MILVGAGFHGEVQITAARPAVFSGEVAGLYRDFLDGVGSLLGGLILLAPHTIGGVHPFNHDGLRTRGQTVDAQHCIGGLLRAWQYVQNGQRIADITHSAGTGAVGREERQQIRSFVVHLMADFAAFRFQQRGFGVDRNRLGRSAYLKNRIDADSFGHLHHQAGPFELLKARRLHGKHVRACRKIGQRVIAGAGAANLIEGGRFAARYLNVGVGNDGSCRIRNRSSNRAAISLSKRRYGAHQQKACHSQLHLIRLPNVQSSKVVA